MLTLESKFSEFMKMFMDAGACSSAKDYTEAFKIGTDETIEQALTDYEKVENKNDDFVKWFVRKFGQEMERVFRLRYISTITHPISAFSLLKCEFLTEDEQTYLKRVAENETEIQKVINSISDPMKAATMLINFPNLTNTQEMVLRDKFEGLLPTVEKELSTGVIVTAKSQVTVKP